MFRRLWERWQEKRRLRSSLSPLFSKHVSRAVADRVLADGLDGKTEVPSVERRVHFAFVDLQSHEPAEVERRVQLVLKIAEAHGALVEAVYPVTTLVYGMIESGPQGDLQSLVQDLHRHAPWCSIVHGSTQATVGLIGSKVRCEFGFWWPQKGAAIAYLRTLAPGEVACWPGVAVGKLPDQSTPE